MKYGRIGTALVLFSVAAIGLAGCESGAHGPGDSKDSDLGQVALQLAQTPSGVQCLVLTVVAPSRTVARDIDVTPGQAVSVTESELPTGTVQVGAAAYATTCATVTASSIPTWVSDPPTQTMTLTKGVPVPLTLTLRPNGVLDWTVNWVDDQCPAGNGPASGPTMKYLPQGFCIDTTEVTRGQYAAWLQTNPAVTGQATTCSWNLSFSPDPTCLGQATDCGADCGKHPQVCVDWCDAAAFCTAAGKRLCGKIGGGSNAFDDTADASKSQWYAACTSGGQYSYSYGNAWNGDSVALCNDLDNTLNRQLGGQSGGTTPVATFATCTSPDPRYSEVYDLTGNVWEWEDSCDGTTNGDDFCHIRGGTYYNCYGAGACDYPYNDDGCYYGARIKRSAADGITGFRCCAY